MHICNLCYNIVCTANTTCEVHIPDKKHKTPTTHYSKKRQWGTEKQLEPLSRFHEIPSTTKVALSRFAIVATIFFWILYVISVIFRQLIEGPAEYRFTLEVASYLVVVTLLTFSALMYLVARQGALQRFAKHVRVPRAVIDSFFAETQPSITVLVPSYSEEVSVIRKTLLSAALQEYPGIKVVLLLDDDPHPSQPEKANKLKATRQLSSDINALLSPAFRRFKKALTTFEKQHAHKKSVTSKTVDTLIAEYNWAANWLIQMAKNEETEDHVDIFFKDQVLIELAKDLQLVANALSFSNKEGVTLSKDRVYQLYRRLVWIFESEIVVFERKKYASLSHEANKAMNLNAFIGLMGNHYRQEQTPNGPILLPISEKNASSLSIPDSDFILTLDADSVLLREYCLRLVYFLQQPDNQQVAVTQTPYSSFRGAPSRIERLSGATTDIQHILHQGMSHYNATFWVGANAVIRKKALDEIVEKEWVGGFEIKRYIQDATVIEDTESSIDLALQSWKLVNYPERLSYSATPSDFGSLVVQRRRWSNGGLLIIPKFFAQIRARKSRGEQVTATEIMLRLNYLASTAWSSFGLLFLLAYPYDGRLLSPLVLLAATPYFLAMASDLKYSRYKYSDIFRIYGFNLILLPVNIAGVIKSMQQALTAKKIPFARTPKVKNRTAAGLAFVLSPLLIVAFSVFTLWRNIQGENWGNAAFAGFNAITAIWAIGAYIGFGNLLVDVWLGVTDWLYVEVKPKSKKKSLDNNRAIDWRSILYHGEANGNLPQRIMGDFIEESYGNKSSTTS